MSTISIKRSTLEDAQKHPSLSLFVLNRAKDKQRVVLSLNKDVYIQVPNTPYPYDLAEEHGKKMLVENAAFRKAVSTGLLIICDTDQCLELAHDPVYREEIAAAKRRLLKDRTINVADDVVDRNDGDTIDLNLGDMRSNPVMQAHEEMKAQKAQEMQFSHKLRNQANEWKRLAETGTASVNVEPDGISFLRNERLTREELEYLLRNVPEQFKKIRAFVGSALATQK